MERLWPRTFDQQIAYHLDDGRAPEFDKGQPSRIWLARALIDQILERYLTIPEAPFTFVELGCGAGDITGPYSSWPVVEVYGYDVVPAAQEACAFRWPQMHFRLGPVEEAEPIECDILVLCEFLEHVVDPVDIVRKWGPKARFMLVGHPLHEPNPPFELGHIWSYTLDDWHDWFRIAGHTVMERYHFPMMIYDNMVLGYGGRDMTAVPL